MIAVNAINRYELHLANSYQKTYNGNTVTSLLL